MPDHAIPQSIRVVVSSPPDRARLVADLFVGNEQLAEVHDVGELLLTEIYPQRDGQPWVVELGELVKAFEEARARLKR